MTEKVESGEIGFWSNLFLKPKSFFTDNFTDSLRETNFFKTAIVLFGIGYGLDKADRQLIKFDLRGRLDDVEFLNNWFGYWAFGIIGGIVGGYILYLIGGWFYNVRVKWSNGSSDLNKSRLIYLFSNVVLYSTIILVSLIDTFLYDKPYDPNSAFGIWDTIGVVMLLFFVYYSVYVSYTGVTSTTDVNLNRARLWFLLLPIILYTAAFSAVIVLFMNFIT